MNIEILKQVAVNLLCQLPERACRQNFLLFLGEDQVPLDTRYPDPCVKDEIRRIADPFLHIMHVVFVCVGFDDPDDRLKFDFFLPIFRNVIQGPIAGSVPQQLADAVESHPPFVCLIPIQKIAS
ncbi:hypothetical protein SDC9_176656 [bioreactor metagenome]|uniref:Uncharacterized protein n=1 Tax=bioreactor metagenome TaxID=1076179 RepID=A0A645GR78_9ZZZZ